MIDTAVSGGVELLRDAVDALLAADLSVLSSVEVTGLLSALEVQRRRLDAVDVAVVAEVEVRGVAGEYARCSTLDLLTSLLLVAPGEARRRVEAAQLLGPRRTVSGEPLDPILAASSEALASGVVSVGQVGVIVQCLGELEKVPGLALHEVAPVVERLLLEGAQHEHPKLLARTAHAVIARLDPDGVEPNEERAQRQRDFSLHKHADGTSTPKGRFTPELTATVEAVLDSLAAPVPAGEDGTKDERTAGQRRHDALLDAGRRLLGSGGLPDCGGAPATILLTASLVDFTAGVGLARTGHGDLWPMTAVRRLADSAEVITVLDDPLNGVLAFGRDRRLASPDQRRALTARDQDCSFPGCTVPAAWTEAHHVIPWLLGGRTDLDNLCLVCGYHHRAFEERGWQVDMIDGHPHWTPPRWLDPQQRPRRNTAHQLPDLALGREPQPP